MACLNFTLTCTLPRHSVVKEHLVCLCLIFVTSSTDTNSLLGESEATDGSEGDYIPVCVSKASKIVSIYMFHYN